MLILPLGCYPLSVQLYAAFAWMFLLNVLMFLMRLISAYRLWSLRSIGCVRKVPLAVWHHAHLKDIKTFFCSLRNN